MNKRELIDIISSVNKSTNRDLLADLSVRDLNDYMRHLEKLGLLPVEYQPRTEKPAEFV